MTVHGSMAQLLQVQPFQQLDLAERRRKRELQEICEAAAKKGVKAEVSGCTASCSTLV